MLSTVSNLGYSYSKPHSNPDFSSEVETNATTRRVINEAVRNIGRKSPYDTYSISFTPKKEGDRKFVPRGAQSVRLNDDRRSTKTMLSVWRRGFSCMLGFSRKFYRPSAGCSVRAKNISNPILHQSSIEAAERIGTDVAIRPRNLAELNGQGISHVAYFSGSSGISRPPLHSSIALKDKDFDSASDSSFSAPSLPSQISFSRPTSTVYPLLLRQYPEKQPQSATSLNSPRSLTLNDPPTRPPRPPIPTRSPARPIRASASPEGGHGCPTYYNPVSAEVWRRRSPSNGAHWI
jgi:hypothetical protein